MDQDVVAEGKVIITEVINENFPDIDTSDGSVISEFIINTGSINYAFLEEKIQSFNNSVSISKALENPDTVDDAAVDALMSNWNAERSPGVKPKGNIRITVSSLRDYTVTSGTAFTSKEKDYYALSDYSFEAEDLIQSGDNAYYFIVNIEADEAESGYNILSGAKFTSVVYPLNITSIEAVNDFSLASEVQTSADIIAVVRESITTRDFVSPKSIKKLIKEKFTTITQIETLGYKDREQQRDYNNLGIKVGGKVDILSRTKDIDNITVEVTTDENGLADLSSVEYPILRINSYALKISPSRKVTDISFLCITADSSLSHIQARFSPSENISLQTTYLSQTILIDLNVSKICNEVQSFIEDEDLESIVQSTLSKTFMPAFVVVDLEFGTKDDSSIDSDSIKLAIVDYINSYTGERFFVSLFVQHLLSTFDNMEYIHLPMDIKARYQLPDCTEVEISSPDALEIDPDYVLGYSNKTCRFYSTSDDIYLEVVG